MFCNTYLNYSYINYARLCNMITLITYDFWLHEFHLFLSVHAPVCRSHFLYFDYGPCWCHSVRKFVGTNVNTMELECVSTMTSPLQHIVAIMYYRYFALLNIIEWNAELPIVFLLLLSRRLTVYRTWTCFCTVQVEIFNSRPEWKKAIDMNYSWTEVIVLLSHILTFKIHENINQLTTCMIN